MVISAFFLKILVHYYYDELSLHFFLENKHNRCFCYTKILVSKNIYSVTHQHEVICLTINGNMNIWCFFLFALNLCKFSCYMDITCVCQTGISFIFALPLSSHTILIFWLLFDYVADVALTELFLNHGVHGIKELSVNTSLTL